MRKLNIFNEHHYQLRYYVRNALGLGMTKTARTIFEKGRHFPAIFETAIEEVGQERLVELLIVAGCPYRATDALLDIPSLTADQRARLRKLAVKMQIPSLSRNALEKILDFTDEEREQLHASLQRTRDFFGAMRGHVSRCMTDGVCTGDIHRSYRERAIAFRHHYTWGE